MTKAKRKPLPAATKRIITIGAVLFGVLLYLALAVAGTLYASAAIYQLARKPHRITHIDLDTTADYWQQSDSGSETDAKRRKVIKIALTLPGAAFVLVPICVALALSGRRRALYGTARWATPAEIKSAGLIQ